MSKLTAGVTNRAVIINGTSVEQACVEWLGRRLRKRLRIVFVRKGVNGYEVVL